MKLVYAYIKQFRNIFDQETYFADGVSVSYDPAKSFPDALRVLRKERNATADYIYADSRLSNVHIIVGKTGSGKTNLLQLIGMTTEERIRYSEPEDSYYLIYAGVDSFVIEAFNIFVNVYPDRNKYDDIRLHRMPAHVREYFRLRNSMQMFCFKTDNSGKISDLNVIDSSELGTDFTYVFCGLDKHSFASYPFRDEKEGSDDRDNSWMPRYIAEYHRTALWNSCRFLNEYISGFAEGSLKKKAAIVIENQNWADKVKQHIPEALEAHDYWMFISRNRHDEEMYALGRKVKKHKPVSIKHQFIHDLWTDYALYLRKWIAYIEMFEEDTPTENPDDSETYDIYQEYLDYHFEKEMDEHERETGKKDRNRIDPTTLPDYENISILKRMEWLSMYIDRKGDGVAQSLLWQIYGDIKDIGNLLSKLDDKYFTATAFSIPITDLYTDKNRGIIEDLFERMEMYRPDDTGIFTERLLPYHFNYISSGEYQFAKILGGIEEYCVKLSIGENQEHNALDNKPNVLYLLDEPETYMHPELCRTFLSRLDKVLKDRQADTEVQVIITTHSPLLLSDVLPEQVTRLDVDDMGYCLIKNGTKKPYFGSNIHTILSDGFFLDYTIGEYAREFLQQKMNWLIARETLGSKDYAELEIIKAIVPCIGDAVIKKSFEQQLRKFDEKY